MTELLIAYPHIPEAAIKIDTREAWGGSGNNLFLMELENNIRGERWQVAELGAASTSPVDIVYQCQTTQAANYLLIAGGDRMALGAGGAVTLSHSADGSSWTQVFTETTGNLPENYINRFSSVSDLFWRVRLTWTSGSRTLRHSKIYLGTLLDLDCEADAWPSERGNFVSPNSADSGAKDLLDIKDLARRWNVDFTGLSDAALRELHEKIVDKKTTSRFFLVTDTNHDILDSRQIVHVRCLSARQSIAEGVSDWNTAQLTFEELFS